MLLVWRIILVFISWVWGYPASNHPSLSLLTFLLETASIILRVAVPLTVDTKGTNSPNWSWANQKALSELDLVWVTTITEAVDPGKHENQLLWPHFPKYIWFSVFQTWSLSISFIVRPPLWLSNIPSMASKVKSEEDKWLVQGPWASQWDSQVLNIYALNILSTNSSFVPKTDRNSYCGLQPRTPAYSQNRKRNMMSYKILISKKKM